MSDQQFQVGDLVECVFADNMGRLNSYRGEVELVSHNNAVQLEQQDSCEWFAPQQCKLISRPQKTEKKKVWVAAWDKHPNSGSFSLHRYVQIEVEVPVEK